MTRDVVPVASAAPNTAAKGHAMTADEAEKVRDMEGRIMSLDLWRVAHETKCEARHEAIGLRFDIAKREMISAFDMSAMQIKSQIDKSNSLRLIGMVALAVLVVMVGVKQPAALFEMLTKIP